MFRHCVRSHRGRIGLLGVVAALVGVALGPTTASANAPATLTVRLVDRGGHAVTEDDSPAMTVVNLATGAPVALDWTGSAHDIQTATVSPGRYFVEADLTRLGVADDSGTAALIRPTLVVGAAGASLTLDARDAVEVAGDVPGAGAAFAAAFESVEQTINGASVVTAADGARGPGAHLYVTPTGPVTDRPFTLLAKVFRVSPTRTGTPGDVYALAGLYDGKVPSRIDLSAPAGDLATEVERFAAQPTGAAKGAFSLDAVFADGTGGFTFDAPVTAPGTLTEHMSPSPDFGWQGSYTLGGGRNAPRQVGPVEQAKAGQHTSMVWGPLS